LKREGEVTRIVYTLVILLGIMFWTSAAPDAETHQPQSPLPKPSMKHRIFCEKSYTNFAWGYQHRGVYVDPQGNLYSYASAAGDKPWSPETGSPTEQELERKYSRGRKLIRKIDPQELLEKYRLVEPATKGQFSKRVQEGADRGEIVSQCYSFDAATGRYKEVEFKVEGDWSYENVAPSAKALAQWLESLKAE
jgi:hypothetical protein